MIASQNIPEDVKELVNNTFVHDNNDEGHLTNEDGEEIETTEDFINRMIIKKIIKIVREFQDFQINNRADQDRERNRAQDIPILPVPHAPELNEPGK